MDHEDLESPDDVRSSPQNRSGSNRLEGASETEADQDYKSVGGVEKKTKRNKKTKRRRTKKQQDDEEEAASSANRGPCPPYGWQYRPREAICGPGAGWVMQVAASSRGLGLGGLEAIVEAVSSMSSALDLLGWVA